MASLTPSLYPSPPSLITTIFTLILTIVFLSFSSICQAYSSTQTTQKQTHLLYTQHCNSTIPETSPNPSMSINTYDFLRIRKGFYRGGGPIFGGENPQISPSPGQSQFVSLVTKRVFMTSSGWVYKVQGVLRFRGGGMEMRMGRGLVGNSSGVQLGKLRGRNGGRLRTHKFRFPRREGVEFEMEGYWNEMSGDVCMVGGGSSSNGENDGKAFEFSAVLKLNYPKSSNIYSLVKGTLTSLNEGSSSSYFEPVEMLATPSSAKYDYMFVDDKKSLSECTSGEDPSENNLDPGENLCLSLRHSVFELRYGNGCDGRGRNCDVFGQNVTTGLPNYMSFSGEDCSDMRTMRMSIIFSNVRPFGYMQALNPNTTLVGEGVWDRERNQISVIACRMLNFTGSLLYASIGDCSIRLGIRIPKFLSIRNRNSIMGEISSNKSSGNWGYFDRVGFRNTESRLVRGTDVKYVYSKTGDANQSCSVQTVRKNGKRYPDAYSDDMRFDMRVKSNNGMFGYGFSVPYTIEDRFYATYSNQYWATMSTSPKDQVNASYSRLLNVSYSVGFTLFPHWSSGFRVIEQNTSQFQISAEGIYNTETGSLCMVGCRILPLNYNSSDSLDCSILINIQYPPSKSKGSIKGTIESTREKKDALYFECLALSPTSISTSVAKESIWRMDLEITMVLISNTIVCIFIGWQLYYIKKHPEVVPSISIVMLIILTLGFMIPLLLNFEAMFTRSHNHQNVLVGGGGWLEVNEVLVRVVTMVAFLMQFRLLQLTWSARLADQNKTGVWIAEKKSLYVSLALYAFGGLLALIVHWFKNHYKHSLRRGKYVGADLVGHIYRDDSKGQSLLVDVRSYAGLGLDFFLLPQILLNLFASSKDKALTPSIYAGVTVVRLLPHAYDLYRAHSSTPYYNMTYIYANPNWDFFSTAWDVIIPLGGLLFAVIIFLQQRFGGQCILPKQFKDSVRYEKVSIAMVPFS